MTNFYNNVKRIVDTKRMLVGDKNELFPDGNLGIDISELKFNNDENVYNFLVKGINLELIELKSSKSSVCYLPSKLIDDYKNQKNYITKLVILDSLKNKACLDSSNNIFSDPDLKDFPYAQNELLSNVFRNDLRHDKDFAKTILSINGKFLSFFDESITTDPIMVSMAITNDKTNILLSFINSKNCVKTDYRVGLSFISKGLQIMDNDIEALYQQVFDEKFEKNFTSGLAWNDRDILYDWLFNEKFIAGLDPRFKQYVLENRISLVDNKILDINRQYVKVDRYNE